MAESSRKSRLRTLHLKRFRCFEERTFNFDAPVVFISGSNGTGKTTLVEALHYACYVRSFRTSVSRELMAHNKDSFFIDLSLGDGTHQDDRITIGTTSPKKVVKINGRTISSHKDLLGHYRVITVVEDDLAIIREGPAARRLFVDQALVLVDAEYIILLRQGKAILEARNAFLQSERYDVALYEIWTKQLWDHSALIQKKRRAFLAQLEIEIQTLIYDYCKEIPLRISLHYKSKYIPHNASYSDFVSRHLPRLKSEEIRFKRSFFGYHLDDIEIQYLEQNSRQFASRGQQKLMVLLIKVAQLRLFPYNSATTIFILDDFITDFDYIRVKIVLGILDNLGVQLVFTSPLADRRLTDICQDFFSSLFVLSLD